MTFPIPGVGIGTPYGKRGSYWSCNEDASGNGVHTGVDFPAPNGTEIYAPIAGQIRHRSYGSAFGGHQFAISPDDGQPFADGEVFFAHTQTRLKDGVYVEIGDFIAEVGSEGNVSGPHLHLEYHSNHKNVWNCSVHDNPQPVLDHGVSDGPYVTEHVYRSKCGYGEPTNGDDSSDTVKELQERLHRIKLEGGHDMVITGVYDDATDVEVRLWQEQICGDTPDPEGQSYLGPRQFEAMFPDSVYTLHDDGDPAIASGEPSVPPSEEVPPASGTTLGQWLKAQGFVVHDDDVPLGRDSEWQGVDFLMVHHTGGSSDDTKNPADLAHYIRTAEGPNLYPPLAQIFLDKNGEVWMCSREREGQEEPGRASHAGEGSGYGIPDDTMNQWALGIECQCNGTHALHTHSTMYETLIALLAKLSVFFHVPNAHVIGHKEWSSTGKKDPVDDMDWLRLQVYEFDEEPEEPDVPDEETWVDLFGLKKWYSGKETDAILIHPDGDWHKVCKEMAPSGITEESSEHHFLYLRIHLPKGRTAERTIETYWRRSDGDETAYWSPAWGPGAKDSIAYFNHHMEDGSGLGGQWYIKVTGGTDPIEVTTRYAKTHIYYQDAVLVALSTAMRSGGSVAMAVLDLFKSLSR